jgi:hypothetical protein
MMNAFMMFYHVFQGFTLESFHLYHYSALNHDYMVEYFVLPNFSATAEHLTSTAVGANRPSSV